MRIILKEKSIKHERAECISVTNTVHKRDAETRKIAETAN